MYFLAGQADVGGGRINVLFRALEIATTSVARHFPTRLRGVVFVGEPALRQRLDSSAAACARKAVAIRSSCAFFAFARRAASFAAKSNACARSPKSMKT